MKHLLILLSILFILFAFVGCSDTKSTESNNFVSSDEAFTKPSAPEVTVSAPDSWSK